MNKYKITVKGKLDKCWIEWLDDLLIYKDEIYSVIEGIFLDRISLAEFVSWIRSIDVEVISVDRIE